MVTTNASTNVNDEKGSAQKETVVAYFKLQYQNFTGRLNPVYTLVRSF
jgi:hypothetical protein